MTELMQGFVFLLNRSLGVLILIAAVLLVRALFRQMPRKYVCMLWMIVFIRLMIPTDVPSALNLNPVKKETFHYTENTGEVTVNTGIGGIDSRLNRTLRSQADMQERRIAVSEKAADVSAAEQPVLKASPAAAADGDAAPARRALSAGALLWAAGALALVLYSIVRLVRMRKLTAQAVKVKECGTLSISDTRIREKLGRGRFRIYESEQITGPCLLGFFRPTIYLPARMEAKERGFALLHEQMHVLRKDHIVKPLAFLITCVYWFHPLVWLSFILLSKDIESAVDEAVCRVTQGDVRTDYAGALLAQSVKQSGLYLPLAFGESNTKGRIRRVLAWKRGGKWLTAGALTVITVVAVCFFGSASAGNAADAKSQTQQDSASGSAEQAGGRASVTVPDGEREGLAPGLSGTEDDRNRQEDSKQPAEADQREAETRDILVYDIAVSARVIDRYRNFEEGMFLGRAYYVPHDTTPELAFADDCRYYWEYGSPDQQELTLEEAARKVAAYREFGVVGRVTVRGNTVSELCFYEEELFLKELQQQEKIVFYEDVTGDSKKDRIEVDLTYLSMPRTEADMTVKITPDGSDDFFYLHADIIHLGWAGHYIYKENGKTYLLCYTPVMYQGYANYSYTIYTLSPENGEVVYKENAIVFDLNDPASVDMDALHAFLSEIDGYLMNSYALIDTNDQIICYSTPEEKRTQTYTERFTQLFGDVLPGWQ